MKTDAGYEAGAKLMTAQDDGSVTSAVPVLLPFMAPRLQGDVWPDGRLALSLWGAGTLASLTFTPIAGPYAYSPNRVIGRDGGVFVAQSAPVLVICGVRAKRLTTARRGAAWHEVEASGARARLTRSGTRRTYELGWGAVVLEQRGEDLVIAAGASVTEAARGMALSVQTIVAEAAAYVARCDRLPRADALLRSMVQQGTHAALASIRRDEAGAFAGLAAGQAYSAPARTYFRDGYWTLQPLLTLAPDIVRAQIDLLAGAIQPDGEAPSGVILSGPAQSAAWEAFRLRAGEDASTHKRPGDWWSDHFDSPLFFVLTVADYVRTTGDVDPARRHWGKLTAIVERYVGLSGPDGLPRKPRNDRDWADNVFREGLVSYDIGLWVGALDGVAQLGASIDPPMAERARQLAATARQDIDAALWSKPRGNYFDYAPGDGFVEDHLTLDSLTLLRYDAVTEARALSVLDAVAKRLESRSNSGQPYGDWGVLCAFPPYKRPADLRAKSAFAFRYHNGSDWPYLDGLYALERLRRGLPGARYALTRWWAMCLDQGWFGSVEYFCPPFGRGSLLQGWSGLPAHATMLYPEAVSAEQQDG